MSNKKKYNNLFEKNISINNGFTLIEIIVAVSIFTMVIVAIFGTFSNYLNAERKSVETRNVQDNARFIIEEMSKNIRMAIKGETSLSVYRITGDNDEIEFLDSDGTLTKYYLDIEKNLIKEVGTTPPISKIVNSDKIKFNKLKFYDTTQPVMADPIVENVHPRITVVMEVESNEVSSKMEAKIILQTTISSRETNINQDFIAINSDNFYGGNYEIDTPGLYYLTEDLSCNSAAPCIKISADNVVLDGYGYKITGSGSITGIEVGNYTEISIKNIEIEGCIDGINIDGASDSFFSNIISDNNFKNGFVCNSCASNTFKDIKAINNNGTLGAGVNITGSSSGNIFDGGIISDNRDGILIECDSMLSNSTTFRNLEITNNSNYGINFGAMPGFSNYVFYNNKIDNSLNVYACGTNSWNIAPEVGINIVDGPNIGGNYWSNTSGGGHSDTCDDLIDNITGIVPYDGFCDPPPYSIIGCGGSDEQDAYPLKP